MLTLTPLMPMTPIELPHYRAERAPDDVPVWFAVEFEEPTDRSRWTAQLRCGGTGDTAKEQWLTLVVRRNGEAFAEEYVTGATLLDRWLSAIMEAGPTPSDRQSSYVVGQSVWIDLGVEEAGEVISVQADGTHEVMVGEDRNRAHRVPFEAIGRMLRCR